MTAVGYSRRFQLSVFGEIVLQNSMISRAYLRDQAFVYLRSSIGAL
jgi:hypothetical protein